LAPSPTGALHLGNARTFLLTWALARRRGWRLPLRIEDLDGPRVKGETIALTIDLLQWLGIDWDGEVLVQSSNLEPYRVAMRELAARSLVFRSSLSRTEIEAAASAPHAGEHEVRFPQHLRPAEASAWRFDDPSSSYRLAVPPGLVSIDDAFAGPHEFQPAEEIGDFILWTTRGTPSYQLAVVVDDARAGVTDVVRGADLLPSAARQDVLYRALGAPAPRWWHVPLVIGADGRRLAKRHGDTRLDTYRAAGTRASRIIGLIAYWSGISALRGEMTAADFRSALDISRVPKEPIIFTPEDHAWLLASSSSR